MRRTMRFVPLKAEEQLDTQALHRARERLVAERTARINQLRAPLFDRGVVPSQRRRALLMWLDASAAAGEPDPLSPRLRLLIVDMRPEWAELDRRIGVFDDEFAASARVDEAARRLATIPGIGPNVWGERRIEGEPRTDTPSARPTPSICGWTASRGH